MSERFAREGEFIVVRLPEPERDFLSQVLDLLAGVGQSPDDPAQARLNPPVYLGDSGADQEWWRLMGDELETARSQDRAIYEAVMSNEESTLGEEDANAVLRVLNEGRLSFAARLGLEVEADHDRLPDAEKGALDFLGWILEDLTIALMDGL